MAEVEQATVPTALRYVKANAPIDVVVAFSQSGTLVAMLMDILRKAWLEAWGLRLCGCGA